MAASLLWLTQLEMHAYAVIYAENGSHAWQHLEDLQNRIDLVLTEIAMPCLSGVSLLS
jgi:pseudo-response regulator 7